MRCVSENCSGIRNDAVTVCELYPIMTELRQKLQNHLADNFFGFDVNSILNSDDMPRDVKQTVEANFVASLYSVQCLT